MPKYSDQEILMFKQFGMEYFLKEPLSPMTVYGMLACHCFRFDIRGPAPDSARRCINALERGEPKRLTPEWDAMIQL